MDKSSGRIHLDGVLDITRLGGFSISVPIGSVTAIGRWLGAGPDQMRPFDRTIRQTRVFDQALGKAQAKALSAGVQVRADCVQPASD